MCAEKCIDDIFCNLFQVTLDYCVTYALKTISTSPHYGSAEKFYKGFCENRCDYLANFVTSCKKTCSDNSCTASITRGEQQNITDNIQTRAPSPNEFRVYKSESSFHSWKLAWNNLHKIPIYSFFWIKQWDGEKQVRTDFYNDDGKMTGGSPTRRYYHAKNGAFAFVAHPGAIPTPMNSKDCFSNGGYDRGHLLGSSMIRHFVNSENYQTENGGNDIYASADLFHKRIQGYMSNIFPQEKECNRHGDWRDLEVEVECAAKTCIGIKNHKFRLSHTVIPRPSTKLQGMNIPQAIWVSYCCYTGTFSTSTFKPIKSRLVKVTNPTKDAKTYCAASYDSDVISNGLTASKAQYDSDTAALPPATGGGIEFKIVMSGPKIKHICPEDFITNLA